MAIIKYRYRTKPGKSSTEWAQDLQIMAESVVSSRQENKAFNVSLILF
jgi:hypothetical protein